MQVQSSNCDILIVGGGLAGLSLAVQLCHRRFAHLRITVLEQRSRYVRDRTWSYWRNAPNRYSTLERAHWPAWRVGFAGESVVAQAQGWQYASIDADAFYQHALAQIEACAHIDLRLGVQVMALGNALASAGVQRLFAELANGDQMSTQWLFDARAPSLASQAPQGLVQHFLGWEINTDQACFEPRVIDVMDFQTHAHAGLHFFYVLPYSTKCALVESTWISQLGSQADAVQPDYAQELGGYMAKRWPNVAYSTVYEERGYLPLQHTPAAVARGTQVLHIGQAGGSLRASTGFAFLDTIAHAEQIAKAIARAPDLQSLRIEDLRFVRHSLDAWMDKVFFAALRHNWQRAPVFFLRMFARVPSVQLLLFLSGACSLRTRMAVALSLPSWPFISAAWRALRVKAP